MTSDATIAGATDATVTGASAIAANEIDVLATATNEAKPKVDVAAVGLGAGAVVISSSTISRATNASVGDNSSISAGSGAVTIRAMTNSHAHGETTGVAAGGLAINVMKINSTISGDTTAGIGASAAVHAGDVTVSAQATNTVDGSTDGLSLSALLSISSVVLDTTISGKTTAEIGAGSSVDATNLSVLATANNTANADVFSFSVSFVAGATGIENKADITNNAVTQASIGAGTKITLSGALNVNATANDQAEASAQGGAGGVFVAVSVMKPEAYVRAATQAVMDGNVLAASSVSITAHAVNNAEAENSSVNVSGLASLGFMGAIAEVTAEADVVAKVDNGGSVATTGALVVQASGVNTATSQSDLGSGAIGLSISNSSLQAIVAGAVLAEYDGAVTAAGSVMVLAIGNNSAKAEALEVTVGVLAAVGGENGLAEVTSDASVVALVGSTAKLTAAGASIDVQANGTNSATASALVVAVGGAVAVSKAVPTALVGGGVQAELDGTVLAASTVMVAASGLNTASASAKSVGASALGGISASGAEATVSDQANVLAAVGSTASINIPGTLIIEASGNNNAHAEVRHRRGRHPLRRIGGVAVGDRSRFDAGSNGRHGARCQLDPARRHGSEHRRGGFVGHLGRPVRTRRRPSDRNRGAICGRGGFAGQQCQRAGEQRRDRGERNEHRHCCCQKHRFQHRGA